MKLTFAVASTFLLFCALAAGAQNVTERLHVDATDAPRNILHATLTIPVAPGPVTLVYPKWIPGNHRPTGPIQNLTGLHFMAAGRELEWQRDLVDMYAFHLQVPAGVNELQAAYDTITYNGKSSLASSKVLDLLWNQMVLYPQGAATDNVRVTASVRLPEGWKFGTALTPMQQSGSAAEFQTVSLTT
ncbi:MAG TPA: M61 family peptidase, partial [Candidatus Sulfotelmatobacter sp.]|nr:M61 family peptidase [Candidatus Sulfotelmatobacter sp.]